MGMRTSTCRGCGAEIGFIKTVAGKIVTPNGEVLSAERPADPQKATGIGYISHFATCPASDSFRKPRKSDRKKG